MAPPDLVHREAAWSVQWGDMTHRRRLQSVGALLSGVLTALPPACRTQPSRGRRWPWWEQRNMELPDVSSGSGWGQGR